MISLYVNYTQFKKKKRINIIRNLDAYDRVCETET